MLHDLGIYYLIIIASFLRDKFLWAWNRGWYVKIGISCSRKWLKKSLWGKIKSPKLMRKNLRNLNKIGGGKSKDQLIKNLLTQWELRKNIKCTQLSSHIEYAKRKLLNLWKNVQTLSKNFREKPKFKRDICF